MASSAPSSMTVEAPPRRSTVSIGMLLLVLVLLSMGFFLRTEMWLETVPPMHVLLRSSNGSATSNSIKEFTANYECVGWHRTGACSPDGRREPQRDADCTTEIHGGLSGYCVYRHKETNVTRRVLPMHCDSLRRKVSIRCDQAAVLYAYGEKALSYVHDPTFSLDSNQNAVLKSLVTTNEQPPPSSLTRGISIVIHETVLASAFASVRYLREIGCSLPVEMWYRADETQPSHPILQELVAKHGVFLRELTDPRATKYYTKLFAVFFSAFDSVLLLDADNFAVRDPTYLFETAEFNKTGAVFWPDYWQPSTTIFNIHERSLVWLVFGLDFVDMFEQESGQVLINRRRHLTAMNALMYYAASLPRVFEELDLAWGDKDLFRFAWMKTKSSFHFVSRPPGSVGKLEASKNEFCGVTMAQHDPLGEIVFLHRNMEKLRVQEERTRVWTHVQEFKRGSPKKEYSMGWSNVFEDISSCWGRTKDFTHYDVTPIEKFAFEDMELRLLLFVDDAAALAR